MGKTHGRSESFLDDGDKNRASFPALALLLRFAVELAGIHDPGRQ